MLSLALDDLAFDPLMLEAALNAHLRVVLTERGLVAADFAFFDRRGTAAERYWVGALPPGLDWGLLAMVLPVPMAQRLKCEVLVDPSAGVLYAGALRGAEFDRLRPSPAEEPAVAEEHAA